MITDYKEIFPDKKSAKIALFSGLFLTIAYKFWKWGLTNIANLDPRENYYAFEQGNTLFRVFGAIVSIFICVKLYKNKSIIYKSSKKSPTLYWLPFIAGYAIVLFIFHKPTFNSFHLGLESIVNLAVGFWEEFAFRGLIFLSMVKIFGTKKSLIVSSVYFSLWHFDVYENAIQYMQAVLMSFCFTAMLLRGLSLIQVSICHYMWDLVYFGFLWQLTGNKPTHAFLLNLFIIGATFIYIKKVAHQLKN